MLRSMVSQEVIPIVPPLGFDGDGVTGCTDRDECALDTDGCDPLAPCTEPTAGPDATWNANMDDVWEAFDG